VVGELGKSVGGPGIDLELEGGFNGLAEATVEQHPGRRGFVTGRRVGVRDDAN
jgi:hypothetical protein